MKPTSAEQDMFMRQALALAKQAKQQNEIPVGAVVVKNGNVIGHGYNQNIQTHDTTAHAEIQAIRQAGHALNNHRLTGCDLYVTLEPCVMCAGAIVHARIENVIFATRDEKAGAAGSVVNLLESPLLNHRCIVVAGTFESEARQILQSFFARKRNPQK